MVAANTAEAPAADRVGLVRNQEIPHRLKAQVRTLYLVEGHSPKTIENAGLGLTAQQISNLANREGWSRQRGIAAKKIEQTANARAEQAVLAVAEAIAVESEELCFRSLDVTRAGLLKGGLEGAKQAQAASSTLKNLHSVAQAIRAPQNAQAETTVLNMNMFFAPAQSADQAKQVTEVEAKPAS